LINPHTIMAIETQRYWLTYNPLNVQKPLLCTLARKFDLVYSLRNASVTKDVGIVALEFEGEREVLKAAVVWLESEGVQVEPVELNTIEG
jgi:hypothetical protein